MKATRRTNNSTLLVGFGLLLMLMVGQMVISVYEILAVRAELNEVVGTKIIKGQLAQTMFDASRERALVLMMLQYEEDPFERDELQMRFQELASQFMMAREQLNGMALSAEEQAALMDSVTYAATGAEAMNRVMELMADEFGADDEARDEAAMLMRERVIPARAKVAERMEKIGWVVRQDAERAIEVVELKYRNTWNLLLLLGVAILVLSVVIARVVYRRINRTSEQLHDMVDELDFVASHDPLTGLYNRRTFESKLDQLLQQALQEHRPLALLYIDLDGFKEVNDTLGHTAGDEVLQQVARCLRDTLRGNDVVARLGGDEFAVILPYIHSEKVSEEVAQRIIRQVSMPMRVLNGVSVSVSSSIGIAYSEMGRDTEERLLQRADHAMYQAKRKGKGQLHVAEPLPQSDRTSG